MLLLLKKLEMKNIALFASGSGSNVQNICNYFKDDEKVCCKLVFTNKKDAFVIQRAQDLGIPVFYFNKDMFYSTQLILDQLKINNIDYVILAGFLWLVPEYLIKHYPNRIVNIHPALLPKYGGKGMYGDYVHRAVVNNKELESGITIHFVDEEYDNGSIIFQERIKVLPEDTYEDVASKIHALEYKYFPKVIEEVVKGDLNSN
jgi:phosphoribosylglycinamide formyltransferase-1